ncbi:MAG: hypothetical protein A2508_00090 [Candidatus Lambdaproteobacteria bacterium RIFOXYD12_FULL_49_8]|uniref:Uncharacterized protein n=1 Tax=Candidatus Lambdaproteobacteria bacterium RIFOXYD2_FULL_50_16 TaxID=1817772 RepID=A0A1F6GAB4_9PROT|nr:MAG: hypothetical protein A2527_12570 [Candidatus Lambdaproteobacteria bacterium RIFOXYD2_FULL_50_16]OGG97507.1 MAG: hypothetical protein A2508_00090 [Candidatus Lambdaproteobacteria bacterium RIFOXYD12_FULL_49_8]
MNAFIWRNLIYIKWIKYLIGEIPARSAEQIGNSLKKLNACITLEKAETKGQKKSPKGLRSRSGGLVPAFGGHHGNS